MREFRLGPDIKRLSLGAYQLPLGVAETNLKEPTQGFTVRFQEGTEEEPDTYVFHAVMSHDKLRPLVDAGRTYFINTTKIHSVFSFVDNCTMLVLNVMATEEALNKMVRHVKTI